MALHKLKAVGYVEELKATKKNPEVGFQVVLEIKGSHGICDQSGEELRYAYSPRFDKKAKAEKAFEKMSLNFAEVKRVLSPAELAAKAKADAEAKAKKQAEKEAKAQAKAEKQAEKEAKAQAKASKETQAAE